MNISRRFFIGGATSFGAFAGCRFFECHDFRAGGRPTLRFGVLSDIHIRYVQRPGEKDQGWGSNATFRQTLEWFRAQDVDAVLIAGDMADLGLSDQLEAVAQAWYDVFPNDRYPDGRPVEKVFVYGNHDWEGHTYGNYVKKRYPDPEEQKRHVLAADHAKFWREIFHEDFTPIYMKEVKGYRFIGSHWTGVDARKGVHPINRYDRLVPFLEAHGGELDPSLPFFYTQHPHPYDTCYGAWAWGHDSGVVTKALSAFPNAIALSGHSHYSLTDERSIWQGAFTSVGTSSLRYTGLPYNDRLPEGYENTGTEGRDAWRYDAAKLSGQMGKLACQGMLWSVYDDCIVVKRREFLTNLDLGDDWVMPLPAAESRPFAFAEHAKKVGAPSFISAAKLEVRRTKVKNRGGKSPDGSQTVAAVEKDAFTMTAPAAVPNRYARLYELEFTAESKTGERKSKVLMAEGFNHSAKSEKAKARTTCFFALDELPKGEVRFRVTPKNCFHRAGESLVSDWFAV